MSSVLPAASTALTVRRARSCCRSNFEPLPVCFPVVYVGGLAGVWGGSEVLCRCSFVLKETRETELSCMRVLDEVRCIVTGNDDGSLRCWDLSSGTSVPSFLAPPARIGLRAVRCVLPDGRCWPRHLSLLSSRLMNFKLEVEVEMEVVLEVEVECKRDLARRVDRHTCRQAHGGSSTYQHH